MADSKWRASQDEDTDQTFAHADALCLYLGYGFRGPERRLRHGGLFLPRRAQLAGRPRADPHRVRFRRRAQKTGPAIRLAEGEVGAQDPAGGGPRLRHLPVRGLSGSADRHHHQPVHGQGRVPDGHVRCAGAGVRPLSGPEGQRSALGQHGHRRGGPVYALHEERLRRH